MSELVTLAEVEAAAARIAGVATRTPLVPYAGGAPLIKAESLQPTGAFKLRGAHATISALPAGTRGVVAHSSGNHARAVAYAARARGLPAVIVVPDNASPAKVAATRALGAEIVVVAPGQPARRAATRRIAAERGYAVVPPFDDRRVIAGQGTVGLEIVADAPNVDLVVVPVGGGGLLAGVAAAVTALRPRARVVGVEPELAADAAESLRRGARVAWPPEKTAQTIADALRVEQVGELPYAHLTRLVDDVVTVSEDEIRAAMRLLAVEARLVAEPGGAVAVAACLFRRGALPRARACVAVLSGGNVEPTLLAEVVTGGGYAR